MNATVDPCQEVQFDLSLDELLSRVSQSFPPKALAPIFHQS